MRAFILSLILILNLQPADALEVQLNPQGLSASESTAAQNLLDKAISLLPTSMQTRLGKKITLSFEDLHEHGHTTVDRIVLSKSLLPYILPGTNTNTQNTTSRSHHSTYYKIALGTILHEIAHQYDFNTLKNLPGSELRRNCLNLKSENSKKDTANIPSECVWHLYRYNISDNPQFLYALNWTEKAIVNNTIVEEDDATNRSPNPYEFKSPQEAFAVNFEFFLLDPEYKCRRPTSYRFLQNHFNHTPFADHQCQQGKYLMTMISNTTSTSYVFETIDPKRIAAVHYLLAGDGEAAMSMWGHSMIRLVICAPERKEVGPDCLKDLAYHRIVSYRAGVTDLAIDTWKGISGGYPSRIFILPLLNVINEYTKLEMRELFSFPLKLTRSQIEDFATRMTEQYWGYRGKYYFASNNCAVETFNLLKMINPQNTDFASEKTVTPKGVRDLLRVKNYAENISEEQIKKNPLLYWPSKKEYFQSHIEAINSGAGTQFKSSKEFLDLQPSQHKIILQSLIKNKARLSSFFILEVLKLESLTLYKNRILLSEEAKNQNSEMLKTLKEKLKDLGQFVGNHYKGTYGIPFDNEVEFVKTTLTEQSQKEAAINSNLEKQMHDKAVQLLGKEFMYELELSQELILQTSDLIRNSKK